MADFNTIEQRISAGGRFDGSIPTTTPVIRAGVQIYPADTSGGLFRFQFSDTTWTWVVTSIQAKFDGVAIKGIYIHPHGEAVPHADDIPVWESTLAVEEYVLISPPDQIILNQDRDLIIISDPPPIKVPPAEMFVRVIAQNGLNIPASKEE